MIPSLAPLYVGPLADFAEKLQWRQTPRVDQAGDAFFAAKPFARFLDGLQVRHRTDERIALASLWSKWYFSTFLGPYMGANLLLQRQLPIALEQTGLVLGDDDRPQALHLASDGQLIEHREGFARFHDLIEHHLTPVIHSLASATGASPRLFWSNAGNTFEFVTTRLELHPLALPGCTAAAHEVLNARLLPDGRRNPLFAPVRYLPAAPGDEEPPRLRRICCIRYRLAGVGYCSSCPLECRHAARTR